ALWVIPSFQNIFKCLNGQPGNFLLSGCFIKLTESYGRKAIGEYIVRLHQRRTLSVQGKIKSAFFITAMLFQKINAQPGNIQPALSLFHLVVEHREGPSLPSLEPKELVGVIYFPLSVQTG